MDIKTWLVVLGFSISMPAVSQTVEGRNEGKVNLSAFFLKGFGVQYERQVGSRTTIALAYSKIPTSALAFTTYIKNQINDPSIDVSQFKLGTSVFTPEVKFYLGKKGAFRGFYLAPYARISSYKLQGPINFTSSQNVIRSALFSGTLSSYTAGLMVGSSFRLSKILYLDCWIAGASIGAGNGDFNAEADLAPTEQQSLKSVLDNMSIPFTSTENTVNSTGATVTTKGRIIGFRGLGINVGIRF